MKQVRFRQVGCAMRGAVFIHQKWKIYVELFSKVLREVDTTKTDGGDVRALFRDLCPVVTQLRDMLPAEDSTPMPQKNNDRGLSLP